MVMTFLKTVVRKASKARFNAFIKLFGLVLGNNLSDYLVMGYFGGKLRRFLAK